MLILGLSAFKNNSSAALVEDGIVQAAVENDKLARTVTKGVPSAAMNFCLGKTGGDQSQLDCIAVATQPSQRWLRRTGNWANFPFSAPLAAISNVTQDASALASGINELRRLGERNGHSSPPAVLTFEHHLCHAASAFFLSPFDRALIVTLDEDGDGISGMIAVGEGARIRVLKRIPVHHSLAWLYSQVTELIGFVPRREEHKTQWLSLEGEPTFKNVFLGMLRRSGSNLPHLDRSFCAWNSSGRMTLGDEFYRQARILAPDRRPSEDQRRELAASVQFACTEIVSGLVGEFLGREGLENVCLGGGLFLNSLLVSDIEKRCGMGRIFVPPGPGNSGTALGAALLAWHRTPNRPRRDDGCSVYWGPEFSHQEVKEVLDNCKARYSIQNTQNRKVECTLQLINAAKIVGWYQGATEFGPRALGNRSVLASPWAPYVRENLNDFIKHREWFRPFAVAVPAEDSCKYFEASEVCSLMNSLATVRPDCSVLPAEFLLPGRRLRVQTVNRKANPLFWQLLKQFGEKAPAPILLNTSFNLFGEPLVVSPRDAVRSYSCSGLDALVMHNFVLSKASNLLAVVSPNKSTSSSLVGCSLGA
jgi:carbamoyltransferase